MFNSKQERSISSVPVHIIFSLLFFISLQAYWHYYQNNLSPDYIALSEPLSDEFIKLSSLNDPISASKILMLYLQAHDNQPGLSVPFLRLDYAMVIKWLEQAVRLDERIQYPLLAASRIYSEVNDESKQRQMLKFVSNEFLNLPSERWQWMAHIIFVAKHKLKDQELALKYAKQLRLNTTENQAPNWARHMELYILEDMDDIEAAKILIGGLLASEELQDANEIRFLENRLKEYSVN